MVNTRRTARPLLFALLAALTAGAVALPLPVHAQKPPAAAARRQPLSDALKGPRPEAGEWFGLYLLGKKVGHVYTELALVPGSPDKAKAVSSLYFKADVGARTSERRHIETRIYESKPNGRLLSFVIEQSGDGGEQRIEGTNAPNGLRILRKRPGYPDDVRTLPATPETIEAADQARVALVRNAAVEDPMLDGTDLETYKMSSSVGKPIDRLIGGVKVKLRTVTTISEKEKVPTLTYFTPDGATVEISMGDTMRAVAEPEDVARRLDKVEVFGLTRVVLPKPIPEERRSVPGEVKLVVSGLPERFQRESFRQKFKAQPDGRTELTLLSVAPAKEKRAQLPVTDPSKGEYLKSSMAVEADNPEIKALAKKIVGSEKDAYTAAKKIVAWVYANMRRDYGASSDRASDVLRQMKGDCTEHSLLAVSLLRAAGIPAKRVDGLVYLMNSDQVPALYWHEWVEAYVGDWTQLDPTFNQPVADATHLALGEEGGAEITPLIGTLKVHDVR